MSVRGAQGASPQFPWLALLRASSLHVGAAASAAALRRDLVETGQLSADHFDEAYAVARVTPGTNLLAMYVLIGERFAGWRGAMVALVIGAFVPALVAVTLGVAYVESSGRPLTQHLMQGARVGAQAVFAWAVIRLARPQLRTHGWRGVAVVLMTGALMWSGTPTLVVLLAAGMLGAVLLGKVA